MESLLSEFTNVIAAMNSILDELAEWGLKKQQLILKGQVEELERLIKEEHICAAKLEKTEGDRFKLQVEIGRRWGIKGGGLMAEKILNKVKEESPSSFSALYAAISRLGYNLTRIKAINEHNNELIQQSLDYIKVVETMINGDTTGIYSNRGIQPNESKYLANLLDKKV
ncbi:MAG: flagellar protein FlgN [Syntrophomonadaceae bacterium]|jgi:flagellar biosynthesis/type III secretory pathway chaperone